VLFFSKKVVNWFEMAKFNSCGQIQIWFVRQNLVLFSKIGPSAFMQSFCLVYPKYKLLKNYFPKSYIGRGPISKHSTPRVKPFHKPTTNTQASASTKLQR
jgi:hypothetical protein